MFSSELQCCNCAKKERKNRPSSLWWSLLEWPWWGSLLRVQSTIQSLRLQPPLQVHFLSKLPRSSWRTAQSSGWECHNQRAASPTQRFVPSSLAGKQINVSWSKYIKNICTPLDSEKNPLGGTRCSCFMKWQHQGFTFTKKQAQKRGFALPGCSQGSWKSSLVISIALVAMKCSRVLDCLKKSCPWGATCNVSLQTDSGASLKKHKRSRQVWKKSWRCIIMYILLSFIPYSIHYAPFMFFITSSILSLSPFSLFSIHFAPLKCFFSLFLGFLFSHHFSSLRHVVPSRLLSLLFSFLWSSPEFPISVSPCSVLFFLFSVLPLNVSRKGTVAWATGISSFFCSQCHGFLFHKNSF